MEILLLHVRLSSFSEQVQIGRQEHIGWRTRLDLFGQGVAGGIRDLWSRLTCVLGKAYSGFIEGVLKARGGEHHHFLALCLSGGGQWSRAQAEAQSQQGYSQQR